MEITETNELVESMFTIIKQLLSNEITSEQIFSEFTDKEFKVLRKNLFDQNSSNILNYNISAKKNVYIIFNNINS
jgi:hypothetical protein